MKNQSRSNTVPSSLGFFFLGLSGYGFALPYIARENSFWAANFVAPLLLTAVFGLGWWFESLYEGLILSRGRKLARRAYFGLALVSLIIVLGSFVLMPSSFIQFAIGGSVFILWSSFLLRFSVARPEVIAKLWESN